MPEATLTLEMWAVLGVLAFTVFLFVSEIVRVDVAAVLIMVLLGATSLIPGYPGLVPGEHLFDGFASNAVVSIIAVMIIGAGLDKTGILSRLAGKILRVAGRTESRVLTLVSVTVGLISSFMQNIGAAALFLPVVDRISKRGNIPLSRLLMPMGFCAILGGTLTMVGSSPLILLNDLILTSNRGLPEGVEPMATFDLFAVTPIGIVMITVGVLYFVLLGRHLLPDRQDRSEGGSTMQYFKDLYGIVGEIYELRVSAESELDGKTIADFERMFWPERIVALRTAGSVIVEPPIDTLIQAGADVALLANRDRATAIAERAGLELRSDMNVFSEILSPISAGIAEVVIPPDSSVIGKSPREIAFRKTYRASVLAIYRVDGVIKEDLPNIPFQAGDTLLLHLRWKELANIARSKDFVVATDFPRDDSRPDKLKYAAGFFALTLALVIFSDLRLSAALMVGAIGMIVSGVIKIEEAYDSIGWQSVFLLASLIPLGVAVESTGTAAWIAQQSLRLLGDVPIWVMQAMIAVLATVFTLVMSNVGATVLLVPLAVNIALGAGADPAMFALTVALATSNSFLIPTHQVNALIMGPGGYRVADFMRAGGIMTVLFLAIMLLMLNLFY